jgi:thiol-disulfide isomerase/thioredoxin
MPILIIAQRFNPTGTSLFFIYQHKNHVMKVRFVKFAVLIAISGLSLFSAQQLKAQSTSGTKIYGVVNRATWCPVCQANGERFMKEVMPAVSNLGISFVTNDLTNHASILQSDKVLRTDKLLNAVGDIKSTGVLILVDNSSKKVLRTLSLAEPTEKLVAEIKASLQ